MIYPLIADYTKKHIIICSFQNNRQLQYCTVLSAGFCDPYSYIISIDTLIHDTKNYFIEILQHIRSSLLFKHAPMYYAANNAIIHGVQQVSSSNRVHVVSYWVISELCKYSWNKQKWSLIDIISNFVHINLYNYMKQKCPSTCLFVCHTFVMTKLRLSRVTCEGVKYDVTDDVTYVTLP